MRLRSSCAIFLLMLGGGCGSSSNTAEDGSAGSSGAAGASGSGGLGGDAAGGRGGGAGTVDGGRRDSSSDAMCSPVVGHVASAIGPDILLVLDASGSMNDDLMGQTCKGGCGPNSKWAQMVPAIQQILAMTDANVNWGAKIFAEAGTTCTVNEGVSVPVGPANAAAISAALLARTGPNGGLVDSMSLTPTRLAEAAAVAYLSNVKDNNPKYILLATDGAPNCMPGATPQQLDYDDAAGAVQAVKDALAAGFPTFVVGIGSPQLSLEATLGMLANAGGRARTATPAYYPAHSAAELATALNELVGVARCRFALGDPPIGGSHETIQVQSGGTAIPRDQSRNNGWDYTDAAHDSIDLYGPACASVQSSPTGQVSIVYPCND